jgi:hypothetical protein
MTSLKIVIVSQHCYPKLGPRSHRATELAKELASRGHEVVLYALLGDYDYTEISKEFNVKFKGLGVSKLGISDNIGHSNRNLLLRLLKKLLRHKLEYPFIELVYLVKKALKQEGDIDYLITSAHPHTIHWGAAHYISKNRHKIKFWVADCGDPFMNDPYNNHPFYFAEQERKWNRLCNYITVPIDEAKEAYCQKFRSKIRVIPQGFNFDKVKLADYKSNKIPTFAYSGVVYKGKRDPSLFLEYLYSLDFEFKFVIYANNNKFYEPFIDKLGNKLEIRNYIPREELIYELSKMDFLINIKNVSEVQAPSKLIDYALTTRPILQISSEFNESKYVEEFLGQNYTNQMIIENIENYNIKNVVNKFIKLFEI